MVQVFEEGSLSAPQLKDEPDKAHMAYTFTTTVVPKNRLIEGPIVAPVVSSYCNNMTYRVVEVVCLYRATANNTQCWQ